MHAGGRGILTNWATICRRIGHHHDQRISIAGEETTLLAGHPVFWVLAAAVLAPLLAEIPIGFRVPVVVLEILLGIVLGPHVLNYVQFDGFLETMYSFGMAATLFMGGMELDFADLSRRPMFLAVMGWAVSVALGATIVGILHVIPDLNAPLMVTLALCTTGLGVLTPTFRDNGQLQTSFGRLVLAAGTIGEVAPIAAMSLLLSRQHSTWQQGAYLLVFALIIAIALAVGLGARPPKVLEMLRRHMHRTTQLPVRVSLLMLASLLLLAHNFGFESFSGAFAAGMILAAATRNEGGSVLREKMETLSFGWFYPFFFVGAGIKFDLGALAQHPAYMLLMPLFAGLFLVVRGLPVLLYREHLSMAQRLPLALCSAVPSLTIIVVITEVGVRTQSMSHDVAAAMVGAAMLSVLLYPTVAGALLSRKRIG
jgi:Kef-type K+ transport system membrane component KefB